jgi:uncharacterized pyridoxal phosphate-containing UPF0001 family protein
MDVLIEVNVSGEVSKHGITAAAVRHVVQQMDTMVNLRTRGLMVMAPLEGGLDAARETFRRGAELFHDVRGALGTGIGVGSGPGEAFDLLSMGMSGDFELAIEAGANIVRVGSAVIGAPSVESTTEQETP